jgi:hypothetical protein
VQVGSAQAQLDKTLDLDALTRWYTRKAGAQLDGTSDQHLTAEQRQKLQRLLEALDPSHTWEQLMHPEVSAAGDVTWLCESHGANSDAVVRIAECGAVLGPVCRLQRPELCVCVVCLGRCPV